MHDGSSEEIKLMLVCISRESGRCIQLSMLASAVLGLGSLVHRQCIIINKERLSSVSVSLKPKPELKYVVVELALEAVLP